MGSVQERETMYIFLKKTDEVNQLYKNLWKVSRFHTQLALKVDSYDITELTTRTQVTLKAPLNCWVQEFTFTTVIQESGSWNRKAASTAPLRRLTLNTHKLENGIWNTETSHTSSHPTPLHMYTTLSQYPEEWTRNIIAKTICISTTFLPFKNSLR